MRTPFVIGLLVVGLLAMGGVAVGCGSSNDSVSIDGADGGDGDGSAGNADGALGSMFGNNGGWNGGSGGEGGAPSTCQKLGLSCKANGDCCTGDCLNGSCQPPSCTSDGKSCVGNADCCGGTCTSGTCAALNNSCKTLGNACGGAMDCCSGFCESGICAQPSYCTQNGDICTSGADCCGRICTITSGGFGTCGQPSGGGAQCSMIDGTVCSNGGSTMYTDAGLPVCGGSCCSRSCAPWGPTGILICQPASGCHPVGDICGSSADCCGGTGPSANVACNKANASDPLGVCGNPMGCKPDGDICRLKTNQCNATDNCCSGNVQQKDTCRQDALGVPRCSYSGKTGMCVPAAGACASSADCCNLSPCVPAAGGGFACFGSNCVPNAGACTTDADCCSGSHCTSAAGGAIGSCVGPTSGGGGTDAGSGGGGGGSCSFYGQTCTQTSDCCNAVPCTGGRCVSPIH